MNATKKLLCMLTAGATLLVAAPAFADSGRGRGHDFNRDNRQYSNYDRNGYRDHRRYSNYDRHGYRYYNRGYDRRHLVAVRRPIFVQSPAYYAQPAPIAYNIGPAAVIGAVIGGYIDHRY